MLLSLSLNKSTFKVIISHFFCKFDTIYIEKWLKVLCHSHPLLHLALKILVAFLLAWAASRRCSLSKLLPNLGPLSCWGWISCLLIWSNLWWGLLLSWGVHSPLQHCWCINLYFIITFSTEHLLQVGEYKSLNQCKT